MTEDWAARLGRGEAVVVRCLSGTYVCANLILNRYRLHSSSDIPSKTSIHTYLPISIAELRGASRQYIRWNVPVTATKSQTNAKVSPTVSVAVSHSSIPQTITKYVFLCVPHPLIRTFANGMTHAGCFQTAFESRLAMRDLSPCWIIYKARTSGPRSLGGNSLSVYNHRRINTYQQSAYHQRKQYR